MSRRIPWGERTGHDRFKKNDQVHVNLEGKVVKVKRDTVTIRLPDEHNKSGWRQVTLPADLVRRISPLQALANAADAEITGG